MTKLRICLLLSMLICSYIKAALPPSAEAHAPTSKDLALNAHNDQGFWAAEDFNMQLPHDWSFQLHLEQRWGADYRLLWWLENQMLIFYDLSKSVKNIHHYAEDGLFKSLNIGAGCALIKTIQRNTQGNYRWVSLTRPQIELNLVLQKEGWLLKQRFRGEYIDYHAQHYKKHGRFRYRIGFYAPWQWTCYNISPYFSNEFFFREHSYSTRSNPNGLVGGFFEDRMRLGLTSVLIEDKVNLDIFWQWRPLRQKSDAHRRWFNTYQLGATVAIKF